MLLIAVAVLNPETIGVPTKMRSWRYRLSRVALRSGSNLRASTKGCGLCDFTRVSALKLTALGPAVVVATFYLKMNDIILFYLLSLASLCRKIA
eukprot:scaffold26687_cov69-Skeletonema_dohrnii-CCMP3373.AAC.1